MNRVMMLVIMMVLLMGLPAVWGAVLQVDFNSTTQDGGPHNQDGWEAYNAGHEVAADFVTADYGGITVTPTWSNTSANTVQQMIDRGSGNDATWDDSLGYLNFVTDFIGTDTRTANGGNGNWNGTTGTPTYMELRIGGLAAAEYNWISFHHDTENCFGTFAVWLSTDGGATYTQLADGVMTDGTDGGTPESAAREHGPDPYALPSTYRTSFIADGVNDVVFRFAPYSGVISNEVHNQIWGMNGFEIDTVSTANTPDPEVGETGVALDLSDRSVSGHLSWLPPTNPEITEIVSYDLYVDPNEAKVANRDSSCWIVETDLAGTVTQYDPPADLDWFQTYYWAVDVHYIVDPNEFIGQVSPPWYFRAIGAGPIVDAGSDLVTALTLMPVKLAGTVTDATNDVTSVAWEVVKYPGDPNPNIAQMIDRGGDDGSADPDLLRDWIGSDTRPPAVGDPLVMTLSGLPAGTYNWTSAHHDPQDQTGLFDVEIRDATGVKITTDIDITDQNLPDPNDYTRFTTTIVSDGSDVVFVFDKQPYGTNGSASFFLMNSFVLEGTGDPLLIDFGQPATPVKTGYQAYTASHEVLATFMPQSFSAFGTTVTISVAWGPRAAGLINDSIMMTNADVYAPTVEYTTDFTGTYEVQLTATDAEGNVTSDTVQISVAEDACAAAQNAPDWAGFSLYDTDQDCDVDLVDFAAFAAQWLDDRNLIDQVTNP
ncbi:MAG: PKD domain-containing protein [Sedimentisphaerales bacterium]|nr:PKD domain-containing protein [Sedimentisphaerales bacterium]